MVQSLRGAHDCCQRLCSSHVISLWKVALTVTAYTQVCTCVCTHTYNTGAHQQLHQGPHVSATETCGPLFMKPSPPLPPYNISNTLNSEHSSPTCPYPNFPEEPQSTLSPSLSSTLCSFPRPLSVARRVMEQTKQSMLVGPGAGQFAQDNGFPPEDNESLLAPDSQQALTRWRQTGAFESQFQGHDTLGETHSMWQAPPSQHVHLCQ